MKNNYCFLPEIDIDKDSVLHASFNLHCTNLKLVRGI